MKDMRIGDITTLTPSEQAVCQMLADLRFLSNRKAGVTNAKRGKQSDADTDLEGIGAELAFAKLANCFPDLTIEPRSAEEDWGDVKLHDGRTVDVKATPYKRGKLIAVPWKTPRCHAFALMIGTFPQYEFRGLMEARVLLDERRLGNLGYGPTYIAEQDELMNP